MCSAQIQTLFWSHGRFWMDRHKEELPTGNELQWWNTHNVREAGINTVWIVDNSWWDGHKRGLADVDGVRGLGTSENDWALEEVQQGRGQCFAQLPFSLSYEEPTDAALCSTLIGCDTQDQNEHQGKSNKTVLF